MNRKNSSGKARSKRPAARRAAEWLSLGISVLLIAGLAAFLIYEALRSQSEFVPAEAQVQLARATRAGEKHVLPIKISNKGAKTLRDVMVQIEYITPDGQKRQQDFTLDYLGEESEQQIFIYLDHDPRALNVQARLVQYRLE